MKQFLRIAHDGGSSIWMKLLRQPVRVPASNRRAVEFLRIERGRQV
ncbi:hypothetical protein ACFSHQ_22945 [Gemmobacter lanyuensis]